MQNKKMDCLVKHNLVTVSMETPMIEAYQKLRLHNIRHLPVVTSQGYLIGIISQRDFDRAKVAEQSELAKLGFMFQKDARVDDYMNDDVQILSLDSDLEDAIDNMLDFKISSCVITEKGIAVGIITTDDLLLLLKQDLKKPSVKLRNKFEALLKTSPLGTLGQMLSNMGI